MKSEKKITFMANLLQYYWHSNKCKRVITCEDTKNELFQFNNTCNAYNLVQTVIKERSWKTVMSRKTCKNYLKETMFSQSV